MVLAGILDHVVGVVIATSTLPFETTIMSCDDCIVLILGRCGGELVPACSVTVQFDILACCTACTTHHNVMIATPSVSLATNIFVFIVTSSEIRSVRLLAITRRASPYHVTPKKQE